MLNALNVDPGRSWKGPWRFYAEEMLECCAPLERVKSSGMTLEEFCCLARCNGLTVGQRGCSGPSRPPPLSDDGDNGGGGGGDDDKLKRSVLTLDSFRQAVVESCSGRHKESCGCDEAGGESEGSRHQAACCGDTASSEVDCLRIACISYDRSALGQTGSGHFSPIGAYHAASDQVLILDVARFKYAPHWTPLEVVYRAMRSLDKDTGLPRGLVVLSKDSACCDVPTLFRWKNTGEAFAESVQLFAKRVREALQRERAENVGSSQSERKPRKARQLAPLFEKEAAVASGFMEEEGWKVAGSEGSGCKREHKKGCCSRGGSGGGGTSSSTDSASPALAHERTSRALLGEAGDALSALGVESNDDDVGALAPMLLILILVANDSSDADRGAASALGGASDGAAHDGMEALVPHGRDRFPLLVREARVLGQQFYALENVRDRVEHGSE